LGKTVEGKMASGKTALGEMSLGKRALDESTGKQFPILMPKKLLTRFLNFFYGGFSRLNEECL